MIVPVCGVLLHSSLAITTEGLPLGLTAAKVWTRKKFKNSRAIVRKINPTRVPIEEKESYRWVQNLRETANLFDDPNRCVHVGDRESDIFELFCEADKKQAKFLVRIQTDRLAKDGFSKVSAEMKSAIIKGRHRIEVQDLKGQVSTVNFDIKFEKIIVHPPIGKKSRYPALALTIIYAKERGQNRKVERKLSGN